MKCWGCRCSLSFGRCGGGQSTEWCEEYEGGGCDGGVVGDLFLQENFNALSRESFQAYMEASPTKFWGRPKGNGVVLEEVGLLADATVQVGDKLTGVIEGGEARLYEFAEDQLAILKWQFTAPELVVIFERGDVTLSKVIKNPKAK